LDFDLKEPYRISFYIRYQIIVAWITTINGIRSPIKGLVKRKNTPPARKKPTFFLWHFSSYRLGLDLLFILFRARYFRLWSAWSLTRISHSPRR